MSTQAKVELAIYDLSMGMARAMSAQFLGPENALDMIPHSGILVFGKEYYFGGGIQSDDPSVFRRSHGNLQPMQVLTVGYTDKSKAEFDAWCRTNSSRFSVHTYNLLSHNCNNFAHEACLHGLGMSSGVPHWVLDVPNRVRRSPMGSLIIPMLEGMQMQGGSTDPFATQSQSRNNFSPEQQAQTVLNSHQDSNPWANIPSSTTKSATTSTKPMKRISTKIIDAYSKYKFSNYDPKSVQMSVTKIISRLETKSDFSPDDVQGMKSSIISLQYKMSNAGGAQMTDNETYALYSLLNIENQNIYLLILLRQVLVSFESVSSEVLVKCLMIVVRMLIAGSFQNAAIKGMAWMVLSNAFKTPSLYSSFFKEESVKSPFNDCLSFEAVVDAALRDLANASDRKDLRQCVSMFLFNLSLYFNSNDDKQIQSNVEELPDVIVTLLCGVLDDIDQEACKDTLFYRLLVAALFTKPTSTYSEMCSNLLAELGYGNTLDIVRCKFDGEKASSLAEELFYVIST